MTVDRKLLLCVSGLGGAFPCVSRVPSDCVGGRGIADKFSTGMPDSCEDSCDES